MAALSRLSRDEIEYRPARNSPSFEGFFVMGHFVYIIYSETKDVYYKGETTEVNKRLEQHNNNLSKYTSGKGPWKLVFIEEFQTRTEALIKEKMLKRQNRQYIEWLIKQSEK